jgi:uncharacterized membrane protein
LRAAGKAEIVRLLLTRPLLRSTAGRNMMGSFHVYAGASETVAPPEIRRIGFNDLMDALRKGVDDFSEKPSHVVFLCLIYPIVGVILATWTSGNNALPLLFPLMSGFALLGPFFALGLYEISRRRELGMDTSWRHAFEVRHSPAVPAIVAIGILLFAVFIVWLFAARAIYEWQFDGNVPLSAKVFLAEMFGTGRGWTVIILGNLVGFLFAVVVLCTTVIAFPLLLDRDVGAYEAIRTSARAVAANPIQMAAWGLIVAVALAIGSLPLFAGLAVVLPVLGHATWHLYRKVVAPAGK